MILMVLIYVRFKFSVIHKPYGVPRDFTEKTKDTYFFHKEKIKFHLATGFHKHITKEITSTGFHILLQCFSTGFHLEI